MAQMALHDYHELINTQGYITVAEPCCGSGRMIYALCRAFKQAGYDYTKQMVIHATDIDQRSVHMTYIQMALYGIPGIAVHGNSLIGEEYHRWYTLAYVQDNWYKEVA